MEFRNIGKTLRKNLAGILTGTALTAATAFGIAASASSKTEWTESPTERVKAEVVSREYTPSSCYGIILPIHKPERFSVHYKCKFGDFYVDTPEAWKDSRNEVEVDTNVRTYKTYLFGREDGGHGGGRQFELVQSQK